MVRHSTQLPWSNPPLLILAALADGPKHGYAIVQHVAQQTGTTLGPGTLYGALARLEEQGMVEPLSGDERRRPYRLTTAGAELLADRLQSMSRFARTGLARLAAAR
jgi:DNA-binding PadR family transcriptional regulator